MKPIIGIFVPFDFEKDRYLLSSAYIEFLESAGACAFLLPHQSSQTDLARLLSYCSGLLVPGGDDIVAFTEHNLNPTSKEYEVKLAYDMAQIELIKMTLEFDLPFLGICRGMQIANVAMGGTLFQDLQEAGLKSIGHLQEKPFCNLTHSVCVEHNTPLYSFVMDSEIMINSVHHQGVNVLSSELKPMAYAQDSLIEAFYRPRSSFFWGLQWHPECCLNDKNTRHIAQAFVSACVQYEQTPKQSGSAMTIEAARG